MTKPPLNSARMSQRLPIRNPAMGIMAMVAMPRGEFQMPAVTREEQRQGEAGSRGKCAIAEQTEVNDGIFRVQLPKGERDQPDHRDHRHGNDEVRTEPVVLLAFVKDNLERGNADGKQTDAPIINPCCWTSNVWRIEDVPRDENQSNDADR